MTYASADDLLGPNVEAEQAGEDLALPSGLVVRVRGMSRADMVRIGSAVRGLEGVELNLATDVHMLAFGLVSPTFTPEQAAAWVARPGASNDVAVAAARIQDLSASTREARKRIFKSAGKRPVAGVGSRNRTQARKGAG